MHRLYRGQILFDDAIQITSALRYISGDTAQDSFIRVCFHINLDIQQAAHSLVGKVDAVYVPTDNVMASSMPTLVAVTDEARLPVICGESDPVRAGGLATLGIDYYKLGEQTGVMAAEILSGKGKPQTMPVQMQKEFKVVVNETTAKRNGITIPQDILAKAEIVK